MKRHLAILFALMVLLTGCDTILQYPEGPGVDPTRPNGELMLDVHFNLDFEMLGEFEYDFENPMNIKPSRAELAAHLQRYTINAYPIGDKTAKPLATSTYRFDIGNDDVQVLPLELPPGEYRIVVWADYVRADDENHRYYHAEDFSEIILNNADGHPGSNHFRDAFYGETTVNVLTSTEETAYAHIELKRPMARYTFISNDLREFLDRETSRMRSVPRLPESSLGEYKVRIVYTQYMPSAFNAHTGKPCDSRLGVEYRSLISAIDGDNAQLAFDYVFTNGSETSVAVAMEVIHQDGTVVARMPQFDVPLKRSHHTTVTGKFLTTKSGGDIGIDNKFTGEFNIEIK